MTNAQKIQSAPSAPEKISILVVSPYTDDHAALKQILHHGAWAISTCATVSDALPLIPSLAPSLIVCERELSDGNWKTILAASEASPHPPLILVTSRHADESLWAEVLNLGGYDVLLKPFDRREVTRVIGMAWRFWSSQRARRPVASEPAAQLLTQFA